MCQPMEKGFLLFFIFTFILFTSNLQGVEDNGIESTSFYYLQVYINI